MIKTEELAGRRALVTGSTSGIGLAVAQALARAGARVMLHGSRPAAEAEALRVALAAETGTEPGYLSANLADAAAARGLVEATVAAFGGLDILVNNAGAGIAGGLLDIADDAVDTMLDLNCRALVFVAQAAARLMVAQRSGVIINLSSTFGKNGRPRHSVYSATKHFVEGFTKSVAVELAPQQVRCVAVGPTAIDTPMTHERLLDPVVGGDLLSRIPLGRFGQVRDVVGAVVFLASPAASLITGTTLMVDGGWTAQ